ncbi:uncharacterized protein Z520_11804 [Fonsecaea multimorphosa CBS 102226]|uniref:Ubiquitin-like domain-containing protein n=1 Tax=Fonsecaea multimorphosa CBS 102226 TaxID=1442371 RepID=A0A0D2JPT5_9EURO|nr:uncharacterized protein Z520_11804 [Fonsecaea multimorphosa CBS 102226]KIX92484.1 hypothetical protein Z520_11804 [Fonsecaea multimorphosa CBS 102226]
MERLELTSQQRGPQLEYEASLRPIHDKVEDIAERLESNLTPVSSALASVGRAVFGLNNVLGQVFDFLGSFQRETKLALQRIIQTNMQIYALLLTSQSGSSTGLPMPSDSIVFEDALGRTISLPYQWFRHWETFEGMLRAEFKGVPGEAKVSEGQYHLIDTKGAGAIIRKEDWHRTVFPGSSVTMSVIISQIRWQGGLCPRPSCGETRIELDRPRALVTWYVAYSLLIGPTLIPKSKSCGLKYYPSAERLEGQTKRVTVLTEDDEVGWSQSTQDLEVFGARPLPKDPEEEAAILELLGCADTTTANQNVTLTGSMTQTGPYKEKAPKSHELTVVPDVQKPVTDKARPSDSLSSAFQTPLDIWFAQTQSVGLDPNMTSNIPYSDRTRRDEEASEMEHFKRVHIKEGANNSDDNNDAMKGVIDPKWTDEAIYRRNICDRFPLLPFWLAHRLAKLNVERAKRLPRAYYARTSSSHGDSELPLPSSASGDEGPYPDGDGKGEYACTDPERSSSLDDEGKRAFEGIASSLQDEARLLRRKTFGHVDHQARDLPQETSFWTGKAGQKRPASTLSRSSHSNNSLQLPDAPVKRSRKSSSVKTHSSHSTISSTMSQFVCPPPPVDLEKENIFVCDICNKKVFVMRRRDWQ